MSRFAIPLAVFVVLVAFLAIGLGHDPRTVPSPLINKPAPDFQSRPAPRTDEEFHAKGNARTGLASERLGFLVRGLSR